MATKSNMVSVKLPKAREGEEQEVFVGVNGVGYRIQRGKEVQVPVSVAEVLRNAELADDLLDDFIAANADNNPGK